MSTLAGDPDAARPLRGGDDLLSIFRAGEKSSDRLGIGVEYERLPVCRLTGQVIPYSSTDEGPSIEGFLARLADQHGWKPHLEGGHIIALEKEGARVTLEPGAQVELSGRLQKCLDDVREEIALFVRETDTLADSMGIALLGLGYHPFVDMRKIGWVPKERYRIMAPYLATRGSLAHGMMKGTAGCQVNLDYASESDALEKLRLAMGVSTLLTAMCANSPLTCGAPNGFLSRRAHIWMHTDPDRTGLLSFAFDSSAGYRDYVAYALGVPMFFVVRGGKWIDMTDRTFRSYMEGNTGGLTPSLGDWELHLTTLFPEVRLKAYVEVRGSDSGSAEMTLSQAAFWKGLLYDEDARPQAWDLVKKPSFEERVTFHRDVTRRGLGARLGGIPALELARELVSLAVKALPDHEKGYLDPLRSVVHDDAGTHAERVLRRWEGEWRRDPGRLISALSPDSTLPPG